MVPLMAAAPRPALDPAAREPLYEQLAALIRAQIMSGEIPAGRAVPSMKTLTQEHGISNRTVDSAMKVLKAEGLIETETGKGLFVVPAAQRHRADPG
jgi:GntR family transcriptional regulator